LATKYNDGFPCLSLHARKMGVLERHGWEKGLEICGKEGKES